MATQDVSILYISTKIDITHTCSSITLRVCQKYAKLYYKCNLWKRNLNYKLLNYIKLLLSQMSADLQQVYRSLRLPNKN